MKNLEMFEANKTNLNSIYGGKGEKKQTTCKDTKTDHMTIHREDGFYDEDGNGLQDCGEVGYINETYVQKCE